MLDEVQTGSLRLEVIERIRESRNVVSVRLKPVEGELPAFTAGQYLPLRFGLPDRPISTYTISSDPQDRDHYRISVKLEPEGRGGSRHVHEALQVGSHVQAERPRGTFTLAESDRPVLLLTGGIGVTPALAMLHELARQSQRPVWFVHACQNRDEHSFAQEVAALAETAQHVTTHVTYAEGSDADLEAGHCQSLGFVDRTLLRRLLPMDAYHTYICGPEGFMVAMRQALVSLGLPDAEIHQESFGDATPPARTAAAPNVTPGTSAKASGTGPMVRFEKAGIEVRWDGTSANLLDFAEAQGLTPEFECRDGICGRCACKKIAGETTYIEPPLDSPESGKVLLCCSIPSSDVNFDL